MKETRRKGERRKNTRGRGEQGREAGKKESWEGGMDSESKDRERRGEEISRCLTTSSYKRAKSGRNRIGFNS